MALTDEVEDRYGTQHLVELTNPRVPGATAIDAARLLAAANDVEADFQIYAGVEYDNADARHVSVGVEGVIAKLISRNMPGGSLKTAAEEAYIERLKSLALVAGRDRILPQRGGLDLDANNQERENPFSDDSFRGFTLNRPTPGGRRDD